jgi:polyphosphate kinase
LLVAPFNLRSGLEKLILREIEHARSGRKAHLIFKVNAIVDPRFIELLYEASQAGVKVDLLVRSMCCLKPGVKGVSDHVNVVSVVGRYLEHSRLHYFYNGGMEEIYMGSADLMPRNLDHRVEVIFPVENADDVRYLRDEILETYLRDNARARVMQENGIYLRLEPPSEEKAVDVQEFLMMNSRGKEPKRLYLSPIHSSSSLVES